MKAISNRIRFTGIAALVIGACNGQLVIEDEPVEEPWTGNGPDCPATVPGDVPCDTEGEICAYRYPDTFNEGHTAYQACACWEATATDKRFYCYDSSDSYWDCPEHEPSDGDSCVGSFGTSCKYPERTECSCSEDTRVWRCDDQARDDLPQAPDSVSPGVPINEMSDEERAAWCDWFVTAYLGPGYPEVPPPEVDEQGYTNAGCVGSGSMAPGCSAWIPTLDSTTCEANLALSTCDAPISELSDCVLTVYDNCWPSPHGCARYLSRPGCSGTMAVDSRVPAGTMTGTGGSGAEGTGGGSGTSGTGTGGTGTAGTSSHPSIDFCDVRVR